MAQRKKISERLENKSGFVVVAELASGPNFDFGPIAKFLSAYKKAGPESIPAGFDFAGITLPQNPGGVANIDPGHAIDRLNAEGRFGLCAAYFVQGPERQFACQLACGT
jgi:hypothetical protein